LLAYDEIRVALAKNSGDKLGMTEEEQKFNASE
jgi:hypothetical protein